MNREGVVTKLQGPLWCNEVDGLRVRLPEQVHFQFSSKHW